MQRRGDGSELDQASSPQFKVSPNATDVRCQSPPKENSTGIAPTDLPAGAAQPYRRRLDRIENEEELLRHDMSSRMT